MAGAWLPRADGTFLTENPQQLVIDGKVANVPYITADCDDEGTAFIRSTLNITWVGRTFRFGGMLKHAFVRTDDQFTDWVKTYWAPNATKEDIQELARQYPQDPTQGSPYDTGTSCQFSPQSKRIASYQGDIVFQAPRRLFLNHTSGNQDAWSYSMCIVALAAVCLLTCLCSLQEVEMGANYLHRRCKLASHNTFFQY